MNEVELDPKVEKFKEFVQDKPHIIQAVREGRKTWQELFEDWQILGEMHPSWSENVVKEEEANKSSYSFDKDADKNVEFWPQIISYLKRLDVNQIQDQLTNLGSALTAVQGVVNQFQPTKPVNSRRHDRPKPFGFRKD